MKNTPTVVLVGMGGYGNLYVNELLRLAADGKIEFAGIADPAAEKAAGYEKVVAAGVPVYGTIETLYEATSADLCCIAAPIEYHTRYTLTALRHGSNVLCEKPLSGDWRDAELIEEEAGARGLFASSGYQWSHSDAILSLKRDILAGDFGAPVSMKTVVFWPRKESYFKRGSGWAGILYAKDGTPVFDSVANNATAHYLHNMLYLLGDGMATAAVPTTIDAELFRLNSIENFDTSVLRARFEKGVTALFIASHTVERNRNPRFEYVFEKGTVSYDQDGGPDIIARLSDGTVRNYGNPFACNEEKIRMAVENAAKEPEERFLPCTAKTAAAHTRCICAVTKAEIVQIPEELRIVHEDQTGDKLNTAAGLADLLECAYDEAVLLSECTMKTALTPYIKPARNLPV